MSSRSARSATICSVVTTVGYGDVYPVTTEGRILAMMLMISGVSMFVALSGIVASSLMGQRENKMEGKEEIMNLLRACLKKKGGCFPRA